MQNLNQICAYLPIGWGTAAPWVARFEGGTLGTRSSSASLEFPHPTKETSDVTKTHVAMVQVDTRYCFDFLIVTNRKLRN